MQSGIGTETVKGVDAVKRYFEREKESLVAFLCELVEVESLTCHEGDAVELVRQKMMSMGYDEVRIDSVGNVVGRIGSGPRVLLFDAHLDVVDAEGQDWATPPFKAIRTEGPSGRSESADGLESAGGLENTGSGRICGRGTVDDKGPFVCTLYAGKAVKELGLAENCTIYVVGSIAEEDCEGLALGYLLEELHIVPDQVVIAESSDLQICRGHRGRAQLTARFSGTPVHASRHREGINPIELALPFLQGLQELDARFPSTDPLGKADAAAVDVACKSNSLSTTPTETVVTMDRRTTTADTRESIVKELQALPNGERCTLEYVQWKAVGYNGAQLEGEEFFPAWALEIDHPLIQAGEAAYRDCFAADPVVTTWGFCTNGNYTMGRKGFPTIGFGPGKMELCHGPDEYIEIDDLLAAAGFYTLLAARLGS
jgi:putative selenium metabolism hydrolase